MDAKVLVLIFVSILKLGLCFDVVPASRSGDEELVTQFPFALSKVKYHRSRYCITAFGDTNCVRMIEEPGDAKKIAKLFSLWYSGYEQNPDNLVRSMLRINNHIINQRKLRQSGQLSQLPKPGKLISDRPGKLSQLVRPGKISQLVRPNKLHLSHSPDKLSHMAKPGKLNLFKPWKLSQKVKQRGNPGSWQAAGHAYHAPATPRSSVN